MKTTRQIWLVVPLVLAACSADAADSADAVPFELVADVGQLMNTVLEPAADFYWDAVGWIIDENGTLEIAPSTDEEWELVRKRRVRHRRVRQPDDDEGSRRGRSGLARHVTGDGPGRTGSHRGCGGAKYSCRVRRGCRGLRRLQQLPRRVRARDASAQRTTGELATPLVILPFLEWMGNTGWSVSLVESL